MKNLHYLIVVSSIISLFQPGCVLAQTARARDTADYPADPRVAAVEFYEHIRNGEAEEAWRCWDASPGKTTGAKYEEDLIRNEIAGWIAQSRLERTVMKKLPQVYKEMEKNRVLTPTPEQIAKAKFTTFRRLAIIRWSDHEDAALPMVLDTRMKPPKWKISLSHYRETTRSSVGDSFRMMDMARLIDSVTKDVLDGKVESYDDLQKASMRHLDEQLKEPEQQAKPAEPGRKKEGGSSE